MRWLLTGAVVAAAIVLYALFHAIMTPARSVRALPKGVWILAILLLPVIGAGLWFWLGAPPRKPRAAAPRPVQRGLGPDDDPEFLRRLESQRRQKQREARLNEKEAELKAREERLGGSAANGGQAQQDGQPESGQSEAPGTSKDDDAADGTQPKP